MPQVHNARSYIVSLFYIFCERSAKRDMWHILLLGNIIYAPCHVSLNVRIKVKKKPQYNSSYCELGLPVAGRTPKPEAQIIPWVMKCVFISVKYPIFCGKQSPILQHQLLLIFHVCVNSAVKHHESIQFTPTFVFCCIQFPSY